MVADLVNQHVSDEVLQRFLAPGPFVQDRPAEQPDPLGQGTALVDAALRQGNALVNATEIEWVFDADSIPSSSFCVFSTASIFFDFHFMGIFFGGATAVGSAGAWTAVMGATCEG